MSLSETIKNALIERKKLIEMGFAGPDLDAAFEKTVREAWPKGREWHYLCEACNDTGWEYFDCTGDSTCGPNPVTKLPRRTPHYPHPFVRYCRCAKGLSMQGVPKSEQDFSSATKSKPRKKFGRFGGE